MTEPYLIRTREPKLSYIRNEGDPQVEGERRIGFLVGASDEKDDDDDDD